MHYFLPRVGNFGELWADDGDWPIYNSTLFHLPLGSVPEPNIKETSENNFNVAEKEQWRPLAFYVHRENGISVAGSPIYHVPKNKRDHQHYFEGL